MPLEHKLPWFVGEKSLDHPEKVIRIEFDHRDAVLLYSEEICYGVDMGSVLFELHLTNMTDTQRTLPFNQKFHDPQHLIANIHMRLLYLLPSLTVHSRDLSDILS